jgi:hypothetical protein
MLSLLVLELWNGIQPQYAVLKSHIYCYLPTIHEPMSNTQLATSYINTYYSTTKPRRLASQ